MNATGKKFARADGLGALRPQSETDGSRAIYYYDLDMPPYLITVYAKAARGDLSPDEKRTLTALAADLKQLGRTGKE